MDQEDTTITDKCIDCDTSAKHLCILLHSSYVKNIFSQGFIILFHLLYKKRCSIPRVRSAYPCLPSDNSDLPVRSVIAVLSFTVRLDPLSACGWAG